MQPRHLPCQRFVQHLLLHPRGFDDATVLADLDRRGLLRPTRKQLASMRLQLSPPDPFRPLRADHAPSVAFLRGLGIEDLFRRPRPSHVVAALRICERPRLQELVECMLVAGGEPNHVAASVEARGESDLSAAAVDAYRRFCFDLELLDATETRWIVTRRLHRGGKLDPDLVRHDARATSASMPKGFAGVMLAQIRLGETPRTIDHHRLLAQARGVLAARVLERAIGGTARDAQAAAQFASALKTIHTIVTSSVDPNAAVVQVVQRLQIVNDHSNLPTVSQLCGENRTVEVQPIANGSVNPSGMAEDEFDQQEDPVAAP